jgi:hypothetical protein
MPIGKQIFNTFGERLGNGHGGLLAIFDFVPYDADASFRPREATPWYRFRHETK